MIECLMDVSAEWNSRIYHQDKFIDNRKMSNTELSQKLLLLINIFCLQKCKC